MDTAAKIEDLAGHKIISAQSSLDSFCISLDKGVGFLLTPNNANGNIETKIVNTDELPQLNEAVCAVDWSWICGSQITSVKISSNQVAFQLSPAGPLKIGTGSWQNKPYLFFDPYKAR